MGKAPAFQFYTADYIRDTRCLSLAAKGAWMDCLCQMWVSSTRGEITYPMLGFARLFGCTVDQAVAVIDELVDMQVCDRVTHGDGKVTVTNRRMFRDAKGREAANNRQKRLRDRRRGEGDAKSDAEVTPPSSTTSSSSFTSNEENEERDARPSPMHSDSDSPLPLDLHPIEAYRVMFPNASLDAQQKRSISRKVVDRAVWNRTLEFWAENKNRPESVGRLLECYQEAVKKKADAAAAQAPDGHSSTKSDPKVREEFERRLALKRGLIKPGTASV